MIAPPRSSGGGGQRIVSLDEHYAEVEAALQTGSTDAITSYDHAWAAAVLDRAWQQLYAAMVSEGKKEWINAVKPLLLGGGEPPPNQEQLAAKLGLHLSALRSALQRLRQRYRDTVRAEVARTVSSAADIDEEVRYLHQVLIS